MFNQCFSLILTSLALLHTVSATNPPQNAPSNQTAYLELSRTNCIMYFDSAQSAQLTFYRCQAPSLTSSSWKECFATCCSGLDVNNFQVPSNNAIEMCRNINEQEQSQNLFILKVSLIVGFLLLAVIIAVLIIVCKKRCSMGNSQVQEILNTLKLKHVSKLKKVEWEQERQVNYEDKENIMWSENATVSNILEIIDQPCTICLEQNTTTQLYCGHQYHPRCIGDWLGKNQMCASCRQITRGAKIYCKSCKWRYYVVTSHFLSKHNKFLPQTCQECRSIGLQLDNSLNELRKDMNLNSKPHHKQNYP